MNGASIEIASSFTPIAAHCSAARSLDKPAVYRDGSRTAVTFSAPSASTASASTSAESMPPERPSQTFEKPFLPQ
ncbi:hypothetical protein FQZ97_1227980 [compost metagenome]